MQPVGQRHVAAPDGAVPMDDTRRGSLRRGRVQHLVEGLVATLARRAVDVEPDDASAAGIACSTRRMRLAKRRGSGPSLVPRLMTTVRGVTSRSRARSRTSPCGVVRPERASQTIALGASNAPRSGFRPTASESPTTRIGAGSCAGARAAPAPASRAMSSRAASRGRWRSMVNPSCRGVDRGACQHWPCLGLPQRRPSRHPDRKIREEIQALRAIAVLVVVSSTCGPTRSRAASSASTSSSRSRAS